MRNLHRIINLVVITFAVACSPGGALKRLTPPADDRLAREFLDAVLKHDTVAVNSIVAAGVLEISGWRDSLASAESVLPQPPIDTLRQVGVNVNTSSGQTETLLSYELHGRNRWGGAQIIIADEGSARKVVSFRGYKLSMSLEVENEFSRGLRNPAHVLVLLLAFALCIFALTVAVMAARTHMARRWLWAVFALVGGGRVAMNWTTGAITLNPLTLDLFSSGLQRIGLAGPWIVIVSFPVGALATLERLRREKQKHVEVQPAVPADAIVDSPLAVTPADEAQRRYRAELPD